MLKVKVANIALVSLQKYFELQTLSHLFILLWLKVIKLPCSIALDDHLIGFVAVDTAIIKVEALDLIFALLG